MSELDSMLKQVRRVMLLRLRHKTDTNESNPSKYILFVDVIGSTSCEIAFGSNNLCAVSQSRPPKGQDSAVLAYPETYSSSFTSTLSKYIHYDQR